MGIISAVMPMIMIIFVFFIIVRVATVILKLTGLDEKTARFQAVSAFTGTGFTTKEAELIFDQDLRRRTIMVLMIMGKVGIVSMVGGIFLSFGRGSLGGTLLKTLVVLTFISGLYALTVSKGFNRALNRFIEKQLIVGGIVKQKTLEELYNLPAGYGIAQLTITQDSNEIGITLSEAGFNKKDILVLSIERAHQLIPFPRAEDVLEKGDKLLCYGLLGNMRSYT